MNLPRGPRRTDIADVVIIHSADKEGAARRLGEAIAAAGYAFEAVEVGKPDRLVDTLEGCVAPARILIWSKPLVFHLLHSGELPRIRQLDGLIEVSADGITPPSRGDDARIVLISGWRGQPFHPGWQRIHLELKRLCGTGKGSGEAPRLSQKPAKARAPSASSPSAGSGASVRLIRGGAVALLLVGAAVGAASWFGGSPPAQQPPKVSGLSEAGPIREASPPVLRATPVAKPVVESAGPAPAAASPPVRGEAPAKALPERPKSSPASRSRPSEKSANEKRQPESRVASAKKYSPKHSKVMRQFCERSGRSTPQCRSFRRSMRAP